MSRKLIASDYLKALAPDTRLQILELLKRKGSLCVYELARALKLTDSAVSQHLRTLRLAGLVKNRRQGLFIHYSVDHDAMHGCRKIVDEICSCGCQPSIHVVRIKSGSDNIRELKRYEKQLRRQLQAVRRKIKKMVA